MNAAVRPTAVITCRKSGHSMLWVKSGPLAGGPAEAAGRSDLNGIVRQYFHFFENIRGSVNVALPCFP